MTVGVRVQETNLESGMGIAEHLKALGGDVERVLVVPSPYADSESVSESDL